MTSHQPHRAAARRLLVQASMVGVFAEEDLADLLAEWGAARLATLRVSFWLQLQVQLRRISRFDDSSKVISHSGALVTKMIS
jgi:hypothetical protein